jgi:hypothetical protein
VDKVTEAIQAKGTVSSKVIKVMILDEVRKELAEKKKKLEKNQALPQRANNNKKNDKAKNRKGFKRGGTKPKTSTQTPSTRRGATGSNNTTKQNPPKGGLKSTPKSKNKNNKTPKKGKSY